MAWSGSRVVADNCHPTPLGNALLARELLAAMARPEPGIDLARRLPPLAEQADRSCARRSAPAPTPELAHLLANGSTR